VLRALAADGAGGNPGLAGAIVAPGPARLADPALAEAISTLAVPVVAVEPGNLRKTGPEPESTGLEAAGARLLYGRGPDTARHAVFFLARRLGQSPDTLAYGPDPSQEGDLWTPAGAGPHPVVVLFHGGFWYHAWERDLMDGLAVDPAARGIAAWPRSATSRAPWPTGSGEAPWPGSSTAAAPATARSLSVTPRRWPACPSASRSSWPTPPTTASCRRRRRPGTPPRPGRPATT